MKEQEIRKTVRDEYAKIALQTCSCCTPNTSSITNPELSEKIGYNNEELNALPEGANLGLGCGNPTALASLKEGEIVVDLGSGAGIDCFLAANKVGDRGKVIGVDMTPEMLERARANAEKGGHSNVEFRLGEIQNLPIADNTADVIISNCVINLSPDKTRVFNEAFRILKPGGRLIVSDVVLNQDLPEAIKKSAEAYTACISGAAKKDEYLKTIKDANFQEITIIEETPIPSEWTDTLATLMEQITLTDAASSIKVKAIKPK